jgi:hypothetical protein
VSKVHVLDLVGLLLAFVTFGLLASTWLAAGPLRAGDDAGACRFDRRVVITGALAGVTAVVAVLTEDPIRVAMFTFLAAAMVIVRIRRRRTPNPDDQLKPL